MENDYSWHTVALDNIKRGRKPTHDNPVSEGYPQAGYFRVREAWLDDGKKIYGPRVAIAIWQDEDGWTVEPHQYPSGRAFTAEDIWTWACKNPIPYDLYVAVAEDGKPWPDEVETKNNMAGLSEEEQLKALYSDLLEQCGTWERTLSNGKASNQSDADKAINFANAFATLSKQADDIRKKEKTPYAEKAEAVDAKYMHIVKLSKDKSKSVKQVSDLFLLAEDRRRKAEAEAENAKRAEVGAPPVEVERPKAGSGPKKSSVRPEWVWDVMNLQEVSAWVAALNPSDIDFVTLVHKIATRHAKLGTKVPGLSPPRIVNRVV